MVANPGQADADGNGVGVIQPQEVKAQAKAVLEGLVTNNEHSRKELDKAIKHLEKSLDPDRWADTSHLVQKKSKKVFDEEKKAVMSLKKILKDKGKAVDPAIAGDVSDAIARLVDADRSLAEIALADAQTALAALDPEDKKAKKAAKKIAGDCEGEAGTCQGRAGAGKRQARQGHRPFQESLGACR